MSIDSDNKLTKFKSAKTVVTADFANTMFGGLYGSAEGDSLPESDPRISGHIHDGIHADGHSAKVDLVDHVDNKLLNKNLADDSVTKRNVRENAVQSEAIPEYDLELGVKHYYLDLRQSKSEFPFHEDDSPGDAASSIVEAPMVRQRSQEFDGSLYVDIPDVWSNANGRDFVFGSPSLEDIDVGTDGDSRFFFDRSLSAFRAGSVSADHWDETNRGVCSTSLGGNTTASGLAAFSAGMESLASGDYSISIGKLNSSRADSSAIIGGSNNSTQPSSQSSVIFGGEQNLIESSEKSSITGGSLNGVYDSSHFSAISGGEQNAIGASSAGTPCSGSSISGGRFNSIVDSSSDSVISGGLNNTVTTNLQGCGIGSGQDNFISGPASYSYISSGYFSTIQGSSFSFIGGGGGPAGHADKNSIDISSGSSILGGTLNLIVSSPNSAVGGGVLNKIEAGSAKSFIGGGEDGRIESSSHSVISSGQGNSIQGSVNSAVFSGQGNSIAGMASAAMGRNSILSGFENSLTETDYCQVSSGFRNDISQNAERSYIANGSFNSIFGSKESSILGGKNNEVRADGSTLLGGFNNRIRNSSFDYSAAEDPTFSNSSGLASWSYMFGQEVRSSGAFSPPSGNLGTFPGSTFGPGAFPLVGAVPDVWNVVASDVGSSQASLATMFGSFSYDSATLPTLNSPQKFPATLDGGMSPSFPGRLFIPRANSSYAIRLMGVITCSDGQTAPSTRLSVSFSIECGISTQPDGTIDYSSNQSSLKKIHDSLAVMTGGVDSIQVAAPQVPSVVGPDDFEIFFTHDFGSPVRSASGVSAGTGLQLVLVNRSFLNVATPGSTSSGRPLFGEAVSLRVESTEINMSLHKPITPP